VRAFLIFQPFASFVSGVSVKFSVSLTFFGIFIILRFLLFRYFNCSAHDNNALRPSFSMEALQKWLALTINLGNFEVWGFGFSALEMQNFCLVWISQKFKVSLMHKMVKVKFDNFVAPDLAKNVFWELGRTVREQFAKWDASLTKKQRNKETKTEGKFLGLKPNFLVKVGFRCVKI